MTTQKRKQLFINKRMQTKYVVQTLILLLVYTAFFICLLLAPYISSVLSGIPLQDQAQIARMLMNMHNSSWPILAAMILLMSLGTIFMTHRIAGPVYRLKQILTDVSDGKLNVNLELREKDDLKDLAQHVNVLIDDLRGLVETLQGNDASLKQCLAELENMPTSQNQTCEVIRNRLMTCREQSSKMLEKYRHTAL